MTKTNTGLPTCKTTINNIFSYFSKPLFIAESKNNIMKHGLSGTVGNLVVFRQRAGKTVVANMPKESTVPHRKNSC